jgi:tetratricopeptide (TPR) repeat protein
LARPTIRTVLTVFAAVVVAVVFGGGVLDAIINARQLINPTVTYAGTIVVGIIWVGCILAAKFGKIRLTPAPPFNAGAPTVRALGPLWHASFVGFLILLWVPRVLPVLSNTDLIEIQPGPGGKSLARATIEALALELAEVRVDKREEALSYFRAAEEDYKNANYSGALNGYDKSLRAAETSAGFLNKGATQFVLSDYRNALITFIAGLQFTRGSNAILSIYFDLSIARTYAAQGRLVDAQVTATRALVLSDSVKDRSGSLLAQSFLARLLADQGRQEDAMRAQRDLLQKYRALHDAIGEAQAMNDIGTILLDQGKPREAFRNFQSADEVFRQHGSKHGRIMALTNVGNADAAQGQWKEALEVYQQVLQLARELKDRISEGTALSNIASVKSEQGDQEGALTDGRAALKIYIEIGSPGRIAEALTNIGNAFARSGQLDSAGSAYSRAEVEADTSDSFLVHAQALGNSAEILRQRGQFGDARVKAVAALTRFRQLGHLEGEGNTLTTLGNISIGENELPAAASYYRDALVVARRAHDRYRESLILANLSEVYLELKKYAEALTTLSEASGVAKELENAVVAAFILGSMGLAYAGLNETGNAILYLERADSMYQALGDSAHDQGSVQQRQRIQSALRRLKR